MFQIQNETIDKLEFERNNNNNNNKRREKEYANRKQHFVAFYKQREASTDRERQMCREIPH
jgi:hypothetical protein